MCGIFGKFSFDPVQGLDLCRLQIDSMRHRGPDASGIWLSEDRRMVLAHRRLAVLDLSEASNQPMIDESRQFVIVFNGEIYNHDDLRKELIGLGWRFNTDSDTEVILKAYRQWGTDCVLKLIGMFAFAIFNIVERQIFIARDRIGEKPLFYTPGSKSFSFASELKALMLDPEYRRVIDPVALDCFLCFGYVPGNLCILKGFNKLPPAHAMLFDAKTGTEKTWQYWALPAALPESDVSERELIEDFFVILQDSVKRQMVADVPVGVLLSGGLDSSLVTAMAVRSNRKVKTFNVRFPGYGKYDETEYARVVARHFETEHLELDAGEILPDLLPVLARQFDEPIADSSMLPTFLVSRLVKKHCTVALGGDGGDELFGGYAHYAHYARMKKLLEGIPGGLRNIAGQLAAWTLPTGTKGRNWFRMAGIDFSQSVPIVGILFDTDLRRAMFAGQDFCEAGIAEKIWQERTPKSSGLVDRYTRMDLCNYLPEDILVKVDRASMLNSIEMRAPFLDYRLVEFALKKIPASLKAGVGMKKIFLKKAASQILPANLDLNRKQGFSIPLQDWIHKPDWRNFICDALLDRSSVFSNSFVKKLFKLNFAFVCNAERLYALSIFELWRRNYDVSLES